MHSEATLRRRDGKEEDDDDGFHVSDNSLPPPPPPIDDFPEMTTWSQIKLIWSDKTCRGDNIWDLIGLWWVDVHSWREFFSEIDVEEGGQLLWKKKLRQWWSDNWWLIGLALVALVITVFVSYMVFADGTDEYGAKRGHLAIPYKMYDWSYDPEEAKTAARLTCVPFTQTEIDKRRQIKGPWFKEYHDALQEIMTTNKFGALAAIHLGQKYSKCFASIIDKTGKSILMINPKIVSQSTNTEESTESSSFCPDVEKKIQRPTLVKVDFINEEGAVMHQTFKNVRAAMASHIIQQLNGKCICNA